MADGFGNYKSSISQPVMQYYISVTEFRLEIVPLKTFLPCVFAAYKYCFFRLRFCGCPENFSLSIDFPAMPFASFTYGERTAKTYKFCFFTGSKDVSTATSASSVICSPAKGADVMSFSANKCCKMLVSRFSAF